MRTQNLIALTLAATTLIAGAPLQAYEYGSPRRDHDHRDHDRPRYESPRYESPRYDAPRYGGPSRGDLERFGAVRARGRAHENDLLEVHGRRRYTAVMFQVPHGDVRIEHIRITFGDDTAFQPTVKPYFREGERTCRIDLPGYNREIKRVRIHYHSASRGVSVIEVFGVLAG